ncbi:response regulator transcription factor [Planomicrobium sp. CPCC 101110]|uniref:response regulator transcription factor n=1 Tax=Planomicrobium sp. CPCC 101110 TaxID=2599619 RepID=UPI0011B671BF|nr:helix-turn-helix transcriptional regulator [Planomicrobium sp. CPCC 101110]TWT25252.1 helix-turn-helix transcriptional regulator [Planomicrobium sp. CPCC 101110]
MVQPIAFYDQLQNLKKIENHEKLIVEILRTFTRLCLVEDAYLCRYSPIGFLGEGVISLKQEKISYIHDVRYDIRTLPTIEVAIMERQARYYESQELFEKTSSQYIIDSNVSSFLVMPIFNGTGVIGFIYSMNILEEREILQSTLDCLTEFGGQAGRILQSFSHHAKQDVLSNRELEVMKEISRGAATKEIADSLGISEFTVKQYVKLAIKKTGALNRVHAVSELIRRGIIT